VSKKDDLARRGVRYVGLSPPVDLVVRLDEWAARQPWQPRSDYLVMAIEEWLEGIEAE